MKLIHALLLALAAYVIYRMFVRENLSGGQIASYVLYGILGLIFLYFLFNGAASAAGSMLA